MNIPTISVYNRASAPLGFDLATFIQAMQKYVTVLGGVWGVQALLKPTNGPVPGTWGMVFMDNADQQGALAYHTLEGLPLAKVFVETILAAKESITAAATHELCEMLVDPGTNQYAMAADGTLYSYEVADAVEETTFPIDGMLMSDFVYPAWFGNPGSQFDHCNVVNKPFVLATGGYATVVHAGRMKEIFGSKSKQFRFSFEDRRGHRSERRGERHSRNDSPSLLRWLRGLVSK